MNINYFSINHFFLFRCYKVSFRVTVLNIILTSLSYVAFLLYLTRPFDLLQPLPVYMIWLAADSIAFGSIIISIRSLLTSRCFPAVPVYTHEDQRLRYMKDGELLDDEDGLVLSMNIRSRGADVNINYNLPRL